MRKLLLILLFLALCCAGLLFWGYRDLHAAVEHSKSNDYIEIPRGLSPAEIIGKLEDEGIIRHKWPLLAYIKYKGLGTRLKAGEYRFPSPISPLLVLRRLEEGEQRLARFTVIEGWTRWDIAASMARLPELRLQSPDDALRLMDDVNLIHSLDPRAENLEGYLYPDTYNFQPDSTAQSMIETMVKRFLKEWKPEWNARAQELNLTPREIVTVASLIETEAKLKEERPVIASVIYNRLKRHMALGIDSSVIYASKLAGKWRNDGRVYQSDITRQSPYNLRIHAGLPPGPIASPGLSSLEAALNPASTDYLYYVRNPDRNDGVHNFYNNEADFQRGVQALRAWERNRNTQNEANANDSNSDSQQNSN